MSLRLSTSLFKHKYDGTSIDFLATCRCDTPIEVEYLRHGGILHMVLRQMAEG